MTWMIKVWSPITNWYLQLLILRLPITQFLELTDLSLLNLPFTSTYIGYALRGIVMACPKIMVSNIDWGVTQRIIAVEGQKRNCFRRRYHHNWNLQDI